MAGFAFLQGVTAFNVKGHRHAATYCCVSVWAEVLETTLITLFGVDIKKFGCFIGAPSYTLEIASRRAAAIAILFWVGSYSIPCTCQRRPAARVA